MRSLTILTGLCGVRENRVLKFLMRWVITSAGNNEIFVKRELLTHTKYFLKVFGAEQKSKLNAHVDTPLAQNNDN